MTLDAFLFKQLQSQPDARRWVVALSGGLDSTVLLHGVITANSQLKDPKPVIALHVNHQLSDNAIIWQRHCQQLASQWEVEIICETVTVTPQGQGIEAAAREQRYTLFEQFLQEGDYLLLGQHRDDQAETLLLRLLRGAGVLGLSAMSPQRPLGKGQLWRPFLNIERQQCDDYAKAHRLSWINDESNSDLRFDRNYLRHTILPRLSERWPYASQQLAKTADHCRQTQSLLDDLAAMDLLALDERVERCGHSVDWRCAISLKNERFHNAFRYWCRQQQLSLPEVSHWQQLQAQLLTQDEPPTSACVQWGNAECRFFNHRLYLLPGLATDFAGADQVEWSFPQPVLLPAGAGLQATLVESDEVQKMRLDPNALRDKTVTIRWRQGGERCKPAGRQQSQTIKKLLQEYQLETWLRQQVPLIYIDDELAAVGDLWICHQFSAKSAQPGWALTWQINRLRPLHE